MAGKVLEPSNLVILESTVPPHTSEMLARVLSEESGIPMNEIHVHIVRSALSRAT